MRKTSKKLISIIVLIAMLFNVCDLSNFIIFSIESTASSTFITMPQVASGDYHSLFLKSDGTVWAWGYNASGQLGDGTTTTRYTPVQVHGLTNVVEISANNQYSIALKSDGTVWAWGHGGNGQLGNGSTSNRNIPTQVSSLTNVKSITAGYIHALAVKEDGTVWAWGYNAHYQLGVGNTSNYTTPIQISALSNVKELAAGYYHSMALKEDGTVWTWGYGNNHQLGTGSTGYSTTPAQVTSINAVKSIKAGYNHSMALKEDGTVWTWGYGYYGQLGVGNTSTYAYPQKTNLSNVEKIGSGFYHSMAIKSDGTVYAWGYNAHGQLGDGTTTQRTYPIQITSLSNVLDISGGHSSSIAIKDKSISTCGYNAYGQIGDGTTTQRNTPVKVLDIEVKPIVIETSFDNNNIFYNPDYSFTPSTNIFAPSNEITCSFYLDNLETPLETKVLTNPETNTQVSFQDIDLTTLSEGIHTVKFEIIDDTGQSDSKSIDIEIMIEDINAPSGFLQVATGDQHAVLLKADGTVWTWGYNNAGQVGNGTFVNSFEPIKVDSLENVVAIAANYNYSMALKADGTVWTWGYNGHGELGNGTTSSSSIPVQVSGLTDIKSIAAGYLHAFAIKEDGTVWGWGYNSHYQLGINNTTQYHSPVKNNYLSDVKAIKAGRYHSMALKEDGTVWTWGYGNTHQLGTGNSGYSTTPAKVTNISDVKEIRAGFQHSMALKTDGTVWTWGYNGHGELGHGNTSNYTYPTKVSSLSSVLHIGAGYYESMAIKSDGTTWAWGYNGNGRLGDGTTTNRTSPVQVSNLYGAKEISGGSGFTVAYKNNSIWSWGNNNYGQLGCRVLSSLTPRKNYNITNIKKVESGSNFSMALKEDGTVYSWGYNNYGQLGDGSTTNNSMPTIIESLTGVTSIIAGNSHSMALKDDGTLWTWGYNNYGQLGIGNTTNKSIPTQASINDVKQAETYVNHSIALKNDGTVWTWGYNAYGQLGTGNTNISYNPVMVNIIDAKQVSVGSGHSLTLKEDGTVWAWGYNAHGELGTGNTTNVSNPVQVVNLTGVKKVVSGASHSIALLEDGTVWTWGYNNQGQLGDGTTTTRTTPVKINELTNIGDIDAFNNQSFAIESDGTVWAWGYNGQGQLADGTTTNRTSPVKINDFYNIVNIDAGVDHAAAVDLYGNLYTWGDNAQGEFGDGVPALSYSYTPVRVLMNVLNFESTDILNVTQQSVQASWTVTGDTEGAMYSLGIFDSTNKLLKQNPWTTDFTDTITGLKPGQQYIVKLKGKDSSGLETNWYEISTLETPYWGLDLTIDNVTSESIDITVTDENIHSTQYQIVSGNQYVSQNGELVSIPVWVTLPETSKIKVVGLKPETTYSFKVKSIDDAGEESPFSEMKYVTTIIGAPTSQVKISTVSDYDKITVTWEPVDGASEYEIEVDGEIVATVSYTSLSYIHENLEPNSQHTYRVRPINAGGVGDFSSYVSAVTLRVPPSKVTSITGHPTNTTVTVVWEKAPGATTYEIEADGVIINTGRLAGFKHINLKPNTQHVYRVRGVNESGKGEWSVPKVITTTFIPPNYPENIKTYVSKTTITLSWDAIDDAEEYEVEVDGKVVSNGLGTYFETNDLLPETKHTYKIRTLSSAGNSEWSPLFEVWTYLLETPRNVYTTETKNSISLRWDAVEGATSYDIEVDGVVIDNGNKTSFTHTELEPESVHEYRIQAKCADGTSSYTGMVVTMTMPEKPAIPDNIFVKATRKMITVMWDAVENAIGYDVELDGILIDNGDNTYYVHDDLELNSTHTYRVRAKTAAIEGDFSEEVVVTTLPEKPAAPNGIVIARATSTIVELEWDSVNGALGYQLEIDGVIHDLGTKTSYTHRRIEPNTQHRYRVRSVSAYGASDFTGEVINNTITALCFKNDELQLGLTGQHISDFSKYELKVFYNPDVLNAIDLCAFSTALETYTGKVEGTEINIVEYTPGAITFTVDKVLIPGESWVGVINNIVFKATVTGGTPVTYTVYEKLDKPEDEESADN